MLSLTKKVVGNIIAWTLNKLRWKPSVLGRDYFLISFDILATSDGKMPPSISPLCHSNSHQNKIPLPRNMSNASMLNSTQNRAGYTFLEAYENVNVSSSAIFELRSSTLLIETDSDNLHFYTLADKSGKLIRGQGLVQSPSVLDTVYSREEIPSQATQIPEACFCLEIWSGNYYHWLIKVMPRICYLHQHFGADMPALIMTDLHEIPDVVKTSLELLGVPKEKLIVLEQGAYQFDRLYFPAASPFNADLLKSLSQQLVTSIDPPPKPTTQAIYISRQHARKRRCADEDGIARRLSELGCTVVYAEQLSFKEQASLFANAKLICGLHGAGLSNMLFMPPHSSVIEIGDRNDPVPLFYSLASALDHDYWYIEGHAEEKADADQAYISIDVELLVNTVKQALEKVNQHH